MSDPIDPTDPAAPPAYRHSDSAPFIYFDVVPAYGIMEGAIQIELGARLIIPHPSGTGTIIEFVGSGHIRCSPTAAVSLRDAINKALNMLQSPPDELPPDGTAIN